MQQTIRFIKSVDGVRLAVATSGSGAPLVKSANWLSHLEFDWQSPVWRHWFRFLSSGRQLIRFDPRGCGLSDWNAQDLSHAAQVAGKADAFRSVVYPETGHVYTDDMKQKMMDWFDRHLAK